MNSDSWYETAFATMSPRRLCLEWSPSACRIPPIAPGCFACMSCARRATLPRISCLMLGCVWCASRTYRRPTREPLTPRHLPKGCGCRMKTSTHRIEH